MFSSNTRSYLVFIIVPITIAILTSDMNIYSIFLDSYTLQLHLEPNAYNTKNICIFPIASNWNAMYVHFANETKVKKIWILALDRFICAWCVHCLPYRYVWENSLGFTTLYTYSNIWSFFSVVVAIVVAIHQTMETKNGEWKTSFCSLFRYVNQGNCYCIVIAYRSISYTYFRCCHCCWVAVFSSLLLFFVFLLFWSRNVSERS